MRTRRGAGTVRTLALQLTALWDQHTLQAEAWQRLLLEVRADVVRLAAELTALAAQQMEELPGPNSSEVSSATSRKQRVRLRSSGSTLQIESTGGLYVSTDQEASISAEATGADAIVASSVHHNGVHAIGGGVRGGAGSSPGPCGVFAEGGSGDGLYATGDEAAVRGVSPTGYGASLAGGKAPLHLMPAEQVGAPTSGAHLQGTLLVDAEATLWVCIAEGTPGTWRQVVVRE